MTAQSSAEPPTVREPLLTALKGVARLMALRSQGTSGKGFRRYDYHSAISNNQAAVLALLRHHVEQESGGERTLRPAHRQLFGAVLPENLVLPLVLCEAGRPEGAVMEPAPGDQLYAVTVPPGGMVVIQVDKVAFGQ